MKLRVMYHALSALSAIGRRQARHGFRSMADCQRWEDKLRDILLPRAGDEDS